MISSTNSRNTLYDMYDKRDYEKVYGMVRKMKKGTYRRNILKKSNDLMYPMDSPSDVPMDPLKHYDRSFNCKKNRLKDK
jgi:hypothetical protein